MSANDLYNLTWDEARALALTGTQVRRYAWQYWLYKAQHLWWIVQGSAAHVVDAADFESAEFFAQDWTTADWTTADVCQLAPLGNGTSGDGGSAGGQSGPQFNPPPVSATATLSGGDLVITALLGAATYGAYWLTFLVNGSVVYANGATQSGAVQATITAPGTITSISVLVQSVLPLPAWQTTVNIPVAPQYQLVVSGLSVTYSGGNPYFASADGSLLSAPGTILQQYFAFSGTIGDFTFTATYDARANQITDLTFFNAPGGQGVWYNTTAGDLTYPKPGYPGSPTSIRVPQLSGALYYDESGDYDLAETSESSGEVDTSRSDAGTITVQNVVSL